MRYGRRQSPESRSTAGCARDDDDSYQQLLKKCLAEYSTMQKVEEDIVGDDSSVKGHIAVQAPGLSQLQGQQLQT